MADALPPDVLDALRRSMPLRMDAMGCFTLDGDPVSHPGVVAYLRRQLDADERGEPTLMVGDKWLYPEIADCPLRALRVVERASDPALVLDDDRILALLPESLWEERGRGLRCTVPARASKRALAVRFTNTAQMDLQRWLVWPEDAPRPRLVIGERNFVVEERELATTSVRRPSPP